MGEWVEQVHQRAALVYDQIVAVQRAAPTAQFDVEAAVAPYRKLLEEIYLEDMPYAQLIDGSDLVIHAQGSATETHEPRISALAHLLDQLRDESRKLAKVVAGFASEDRVDNIDLLLSGLARGSLVIGLKVAPPAPYPGQTSFLDADEPVFRAIRSAIQALCDIPHLITDDGISSEIETRIPDPAIRDATLVALKRLSPSGRGGISRIDLSGPGHQAGTLTSADRRVLRHAIANPSLRLPRTGTFAGEVRELDLDAQRFEIRKVKNVGTIRCIFTELAEENARRWLGREVKVSGQYEMDESGRPRLLKARKVTLIRNPTTGRLKLTRR